MSESAKDKLEQQKLEQLKLSRLSSVVRRALGDFVPEPDPIDNPYLSSKAKEALQAVDPEPPPLPEDDVEEEAYTYYVVESRPDDPMPVVRIHKTAELVARYLGKLEDQREEVYVRIFYGIHLHITLGNGRFLHMPDGITALPIPNGKWNKRPLSHVELSLVNRKKSEDGYLGPPEYARGVLIKKLDELAKKKIDAVEDDDPKKNEDQHKENGDDDGETPGVGK